jgi:hypothetical protein
MGFYARLRAFIWPRGGQRPPGLGELAARLGVERVGDRDSPIGARPGLRGLAIGMIAPDEIAPPGGELSRRLRRPQAELSLDLGGRIAGKLGCFRRRSFPRRRRPVAGLVRPIEGEAEPGFAARTARGVKCEACQNPRSLSPIYS